jgi:hypothetical protein
MEKTTENRNGINGVLNRARNYDSDIGNYQEHFINEQFNYTVRLSNGRIVIPMKMAQDQEVQPTSISEERIELVAKGFQNNNPTPQKQNAQEQIPNNIDSSKKLSLWKKLLKLIGIK